MTEYNHKYMCLLLRKTTCQNVTNEPRICEI